MATFNIEFQNTKNFNADFDSAEDMATDFENIHIVHSGQVADHNDLKGRDAENSHPIAAITGLEEAIADLKQHSVSDEDRDNWNNKSRVYRNASGALVIGI